MISISFLAYTAIPPFRSETKATQLPLNRPVVALVYENEAEVDIRVQVGDIRVHEPAGVEARQAHGGPAFGLLEHFLARDEISEEHHVRRVQPF